LGEGRKCKPKSPQAGSAQCSGAHSGSVLDFEILTLFSNLTVARMAGPLFNDTGDFAPTEV